MKNLIREVLADFPTEFFYYRDICSSQRDYLWVRYDEERVKALFNKSIDLLYDVEYRTLIKELSTIEIDKNTRLNSIIYEIKVLLKKTLFSMKFEGFFDSWIDLSKKEFFEIHGEEMQKVFIEKLQKGNLGFLPYRKEGSDDE